MFCRKVLIHRGYCLGMVSALTLGVRAGILALANFAGTQWRKCSDVPIG